jgi:phosphopentomutase
MKALSDSLQNYTYGLVMANLVDFDMLWGHRNDASGFKSGLEEFDTWLGVFLEKLDKNDVLVITSDHGNDPTTPGTDHSREYVPILVNGERIHKGVNIGTRKSFADLQATLADFFSIEKTPWGDSFLDLIYH